MKICTNCGNEVRDEDKYCDNCGAEVESVPTQQTFIKPTVAPEVKETVSHVAGKVQQKAQSFVDLGATMINNKKAQIKESVAQEIREAQEQDQVVSMGESYMSSTELWSWLKKNMKRFQFFTEEEYALSEGEFMSLITNKIKSNKVPASIERKYIQWDRTNVNRDVYFIKPNTTLANPLTCLIQFNKVGNFSYVDEKTFITPPNLPQVPEKPVEITQADLAYKTLLVYGILIMGLSLVFMGVKADMAAMGFVLGLIFLGLWYLGKTKYDDKKAHNDRCAAQLRAWNKAWDDWERTVFVHSFQEEVNGQLGRIYDSVFTCIKQVCDDEFKKKSEQQVEESLNMNELEQMIGRRKEEYK